MSGTAALIDTPKRIVLQSQADTLRNTLKNFERNFAVNHDGRKPSKEDIKADTTIATKYKDYNRIRDVLAGRSVSGALISLSKQNVEETNSKGRLKRKNARDENDGVKNTPHRPRSFHLDLYDSPISTASGRALFTTIGPTPQRDGKVMGLFDMLSNSPKSSFKTPSTNRKMKPEMRSIQEIGEHGEGTDARTPSRKRKRADADILDHLNRSPIDTPETGHRRVPRTPASEGRKFMLNQFFASPAPGQPDIDIMPNAQGKTPLRDLILARTTPAERNVSSTLDTTPPYLKRTASFKDRLLSASSPIDNAARGDKRGFPQNGVSGGIVCFQTGPRPLSQIINGLRNMSERQDEDEDDLDALHAMQENEIATHAMLTQAQEEQHDIASEPTSGTAWRKKGQKRTTKRVTMRPTVAQVVSATPCFVASDDDEDYENKVDGAYDDELSEIGGDSTCTSTYQTTTGTTNDIRGAAFPGKSLSNSTQGSQSQAQPPGALKSIVAPKLSAREGHLASRSHREKRVATIKPNAASHMNFRSLKIRNKNSKGKRSGRGRFGRR